MDIDPRIRNLSYSSLLTLHSCPREFQLYKLGADSEGLIIEEDETDSDQSITFAYGHAVGNGVQYALQGDSYEQIVWKLFLEWACDLAAEDAKRQKSFYGALIAIKQFDVIRSTPLLKDYELVIYNGIPACELSFVIHLPDGFRFRGYVDAVLQHKTTGEILVLECKTTAAVAVHPAQYRNSAQAIGYSIVLDAIFPELSSYKVLYLPYLTKAREFQPILFDKSFYQRALWIQELLLDMEMIKLYESNGVYPMRGESCYKYFRECKYLNNCTLSTSLLTNPLTPEGEAAIEKEISEFQIHVSLLDLIEAQEKKAAQAPQATASVLHDELTLDDSCMNLFRKGIYIKLN